MHRRLPILLLGFAAACAPGIQDPAATTTAELARGCEYVAYPEQLPSPSELIEVDGFRAEVLDLMDRRGLEGASFEFGLRYDVEGLNIRRAVIESDTSPAVADSVQSLLFEALRPVEAHGREWSVRLGVEVDDGMDFAVTRSQYCPPEARSAELRQALRQPVSRAPRVRQGRRSRTVSVLATVDPRGHVVEVEARAGGFRGMDEREQVLRHLRQFAFHPAQVDGVPVTGTVELPLRLWR